MERLQFARVLGIQEQQFDGAEDLEASSRELKCLPAPTTILQKPESKQRDNRSLNLRFGDDSLERASKLLVESDRQAGRRPFE